MSEEKQAEKFETWAIVELFGHQKIVGKVSEQTIGGGTFIRVDVPAVEGEDAFTRFYGAGAIYAMTPVSEEIARRAAQWNKPTPINVYLGPQLPAPRPDDDDDDDY